jgi:hypothetical protein
MVSEQATRLTELNLGFDRVCFAAEYKLAFGGDPADLPVCRTGLGERLDLASLGACVARRDRFVLMDDADADDQGEGPLPTRTPGRPPTKAEDTLLVLRRSVSPPAGLGCRSPSRSLRPLRKRSRRHGAMPSEERNLARSVRLSPG